MRQISGKMPVAMEESAADMLAPIRAGETPGVNRNPSQPIPTISP